MLEPEGTHEKVRVCFFKREKRRRRGRRWQTKRETARQKVFFVFFAASKDLGKLKHVAAVIKPLKHVAALIKPLSSTSQP